MVFGIKNKSDKSVSGQHVLRGRDSVEHGQAAATAGNPLARRVHADEEPDTIDLLEAGRFHSVAADEDPPTSSFKNTGSERLQVVTWDEASGKFYVGPGDAGLEVSLMGVAVESPTELRPGDVIRVGDAEFLFKPRQ